MIVASTIAQERVNKPNKMANENHNNNDETHDTRMAMKAFNQRFRGIITGIVKFKEEENKMREKIKKFSFFNEKFIKTYAHITNNLSPTSKKLLTLVDSKQWEKIARLLK